MALTIILDMKIHAELLDEFLEKLDANMGDSLAFEGCQYVDTCIAEDDPNRVVLVEAWDSAEAFAAYGAWRTERGDAAAFVKYYDGAPSVTRLVLKDSSRT